MVSALPLARFFDERLEAEAKPAASSLMNRERAIEAVSDAALYRIKRESESVEIARAKVVLDRRRFTGTRAFPEDDGRVVLGGAGDRRRVNFRADERANDRAPVLVFQFVQGPEIHPPVMAEFRLLRPDDA